MAAGDKISFGITLKSTAIILGWFGLAYSTFFIIYLIPEFLNLNEFVKDNELGTIDLLIVSKIFGRNGTCTTSYGELLTGLSITTTFFVLGVLANIMLLIGTSKGMHILIMPWLIWQMIMTACYDLMLYFISDLFDFGNVVSLSILGLCVNFINIYSWVSIASLYYQLSLASLRRSTSMVLLISSMDNGCEKLPAHYKNEILEV